MANKNKKRLEIVGAIMASIAVVAVALVVALSPAQNLRDASASVLSVDDVGCPGVWDAANKTCNLNDEVFYTDQFEFTLDGSTLDCNGASIQANGGPATVYAFNKANVTVKNCNINNSGGWGVYYAGVTQNPSFGGKALIDNNTFGDNNGAVSLLGGSTGVEVSNNTVLDDPTASNVAFNVFSSSDNYLHDNVVGDVNQTDGTQKYEFWGFSVTGDSTNNIIENNVASTDKAGAYVGGEATNFGNKFRSNTFENNTYWGMYIVGARDTEVTNNVMCGNPTDMSISFTSPTDGVLSLFSGNTGDTVFDNTSTGFEFDNACASDTCDDTVAYLQGLGYTAYNVGGDIVVVYNEGTPNEVRITFETCDVTFIEGALPPNLEMVDANQTNVTVDASITENANNQDEANVAIVSGAYTNSDTVNTSTNETGDIVVSGSNSSTGENDTVTIEESDRDENEKDTLEKSIEGIIDANGDQNGTITKNDTDNDLEVTVETVNPKTGDVVKTSELTLDLDTLIIPAFQHLVKPAVEGGVNVANDTQIDVGVDLEQNSFGIDISEVDPTGLTINTNNVAIDVLSFDEYDLATDLLASIIEGGVNVADDNQIDIDYDILAQSTDVTSWTTDGAGLSINTNLSIKDSLIPQYAPPAYQDHSAIITGLIDASIEGQTVKDAIVSVSSSNPFPPAIVAFEVGDYSTTITIEDSIGINEELLATTTQVAAEQAERSETSDISTIVMDASPLPPRVFTQILVNDIKTIGIEKALTANSLEKTDYRTVLTALYETVESYDSVLVTAENEITTSIAQIIFTTNNETITIDGGAYVTAEDLAQSIYNAFEYGTLEVRGGIRGQEKSAFGENAEISLYLKSCAVIWNNDPEDVSENCASYGTFAEDPNKPADNKFRYDTGSAPHGEYFLVAMDPDLLDPMGLPTYSSHPTVFIPEDTSVNIIMHVKPDGKNQGMKSTKKSGSELWVYEPIDVVWVGDVEYYPFYFESDSNWSVDICMEVPEGYEIIEGQDCLQTFVANEEREILFKVKEVGSIPFDSVLSWEFTDPHGKKIKENSKIGVRLHPSLAKEKKLELLEKGYEIDEKGRIKKVKKFKAMKAK